MTYNPNNSGIFRYPISEYGRQGKWDSQYLVHIARYDRASRLMEETALSLRRPISVMDIGCGECWSLQTLISNSWARKSSVLYKYTALDIENTAFLSTPFMKRSVGYNFVLRDLTLDSRLPASDSSLDLALAMEIFEHSLPEFSVPWLEDLNRCLRRGGLILLSTPNRDYPPAGRKSSDLGHPYEWRFEEIQDLFRRLKWDVIACTGDVISPTAFRKANMQHHRIPEKVVQDWDRRFDKNWLKLVQATAYPEFSSGVSWLLRRS